MAMSRNARRLASKLRTSRQETDAANSAAVLARRAQVNANLSRRKGRSGGSSGLVSSVYTGAAKSLGYSKRRPVSRGEAPLSARHKNDWAVRGNQIRD